jgi:hypothetical protein
LIRPIVDGDTPISSPIITRIVTKAIPNYSQVTAA